MKKSGCKSVHHKRRETEMSENEVGCKYRLFDAESGIEKNGKYFCLRIDAEDQNERSIVMATLRYYASLHFNAGNGEYAEHVIQYAGLGGMK